MCCKIPLSACFEYSRNISLSCSSHSLGFFSFSTLFFLQHSFSIFFGMRRVRRGERGGKAVRGILSKLTQLIYMFPTVRSSLHQHSFIYESIYVCARVCVCECVQEFVCLCVHGFFAQFFAAALQFENILPAGVFQFCHILCIKLEKQRHKKIEIMHESGRETGKKKRAKREWSIFSMKWVLARV